MKFTCVLYAHSHFLCSLQVSNCQPCVSSIQVAYLFFSTAIRRDIRTALNFCSCEQRWRTCVLHPVLTRSGYFCSYELLCTRTPLIIHVHHSDTLQPTTTSKESAYKHSDAGMDAWRGHFPLCPSKRGAGAEVPFHYRCRSKGIFWGSMYFCPNFLQPARKAFCATFAYEVFSKKIMKNFFGVTSRKRSSCIFCKPWSPFLKSNKVECHFYTDFHGFCLDSQLIKILGVCLHLHLQQHCFS